MSKAGVKHGSSFIPVVIDARHIQGADFTVAKVLIRIRVWLVLRIVCVSGHKVSDRRFCEETTTSVVFQPETQRDSNLSGCGAEGVGLLQDLQ